ncbi:hypothetical protein VOLCADRAFT_100488 [Volvox carteri f. nagariensis]|uniref:Uncharacterized protein n=1 Tax=Volvox carteri f. nagariensis TaxID=3068 RepID=D8UKB2_VOLCA|nr:uncharacterized protein VOLCADRAFT_100488 [Volvox carteri f. nagariensis]EFJ39832.1 hypothetical protein VOLCADRAFT_100488 [Volvox carteri f. nagariensis]|eukprot:XP_002959104.1 hypothetical protein VOLCADRAFT_100488 [Volvox carteri f. nagariensis]
MNNYYTLLEARRLFDRHAAPAQSSNLLVRSEVDFSLNLFFSFIKHCSLATALLGTYLLLPITTKVVEASLITVTWATNYVLAVPVAVPVAIHGTSTQLNTSMTLGRCYNPQQQQRQQQSHISSFTTVVLAVFPLVRLVPQVNRTRSYIRHFLFGLCFSTEAALHFAAVASSLVRVKAFPRLTRLPRPARPKTPCLSPVPGSLYHPFQPLQARPRADHARPQRPPAPPFTPQARSRQPKLTKQRRVPAGLDRLTLQLRYHFVVVPSTEGGTQQVQVMAPGAPGSGVGASADGGSYGWVIVSDRPAVTIGHRHRALPGAAVAAAVVAAMNGPKRTLSPFFYPGSTQHVPSCLGDPLPYVSGGSKMPKGGTFSRLDSSSVRHPAWVGRMESLYGEGT